MGLADGPTEVHKVTVAKQVLRGYQPSDDLWPTQHRPKRLAAAQAKYADVPRARGGQPVIDTERLTAWLDEVGLVGDGSPPTVTFVSRRDPERDLRDPAGRPPRRAAHPAARGPRVEGRRDRPRVADHGGARGHRRAASAGARGVPATRRCWAGPST